MTKEQAKFILCSYRSDRPPVDDPSMSEALAIAAGDSELGHWLHQEQVLDEAIRESLRRVPVPADLKEAILTGKQAQPAEVAGNPRSPWFAMAACLAFSALLAVVWWGYGDRWKPATFQAYQTSMTGLLTQGFTLDQVDDRLENLTSWLSNRQPSLTFEIPERLAALQSVGCRTLKWRGAEVALICFYLPEGQEIHLFAISASDAPPGTPGADTQLARNGIWNTAAWTQGRATYLLASRAAEPILKSFVP